MSAKEHIYRNLILLFLGLHILSFAIESTGVTILICFSLLFIILLSFFKLGKVTKLVSMPLMIGGAAIFLIVHAPPILWAKSMASGAGLISVCIVAQVMSLPFYYKNYQKDLKDLSVRHMNRVLTFLLFTMLLVHIMGVFINIAAIPIVYGLLERNAKLYHAEKYFAMAVMEGYITTAFWSPTWPAVPLSLSRFDLLWVDIMPYGIFMAASCMGLSILYFKYLVRSENRCLKAIPKEQETKVNGKNIVSFTALCISLIVVISILNIATGWSLFLIIPIISLPYAFTVAVLQDKLPEMKKRLKEYYKSGLTSFGNEILMFSACSFFAAALMQSDAGREIAELLVHMDHPYTTRLILIAGMVLLSLIGINPLATSSAMILTINPLAIGLSETAFSMTMMAGYGLSALASPFTATALLMSGITNLAPWEVSLNWHKGFIVSAVLIMPLITSIIH